MTLIFLVIPSMVWGNCCGGRLSDRGAFIREGRIIQIYHVEGKLIRSFMVSVNIGEQYLLR